MHDDQASVWHLGGGTGGGVVNEKVWLIRP
jgi:hypothetical protein